MVFRENHTKNPAAMDGDKIRRKRILFTLGSLEGGGAERVILNILKHLDRSKFELHLAVVHYCGNFIDSVPAGIVVHDLKTVRVRKSFLPFIRLIRRLKPSVLFSTLGYLNLAMIFIKPFFPRHTKLYIRETSIATENLKNTANSWLWKALYRALYKRADTVICLCQSMIEDLAGRFKVKPEKMIRIFNPVDIETIHLLADQGNNPFSSFGEGPHVVAVGRLGYEKGFDRIIRAFPSLLKVKPTVRLWILGKGELENNLKELIRASGLEGKVFLAGFQQNPFLWFKHADLFVLSSRFEGLPNTLLEALACGCPVVALHHPGGTGEVLRMLGLADRYVDSLEPWSEVWWERPSEKVADSLAHHFGISKIIGEYENLLSLEGIKKA
jgi:glycosyltransferase involved in cell wall biosynthesis